VEYTVKAEYSTDNGVTWTPHYKIPTLTSMDEALQWVETNAGPHCLHRLSVVLRYEPPHTGRWVDASTTR